MDADESLRRGLFSTSQPKFRAPIFSRGERGNILPSGVLESPVIVPYLSSQSSHHYPFEALFGSIVWALVDNGCLEFFLISDFFLMTGQPGQELVNHILRKTLLVMLKNFEQVVSSSFDFIGLFLCADCRFYSNEVPEFL